MKPIFAALCALVVGLPAAAAERWPKEIIDSAQAHCAVLVAQDSADPAAMKVQADTYCTCLVNGFQGVVSIEDFQKSVTLPPEQVEQLPASRAMHEIVDRCSK